MRSRSSNGLKAIAALMIAGLLSACGALDDDGPLTAREVIERAADATADVTSLRYTGDYYQPVFVSGGEVLDGSDTWLRVEGTWAGGKRYYQQETYPFEDRPTARLEAVSREGLVLMKRIEPDPWTEWRVQKPTLVNGKPWYSPSYGINPDFADFITDMTEGTLDGVPVYIVTIVRPMDVPEGRNSPDATIRLYIAKDTFFELGRDGSWDLNQSYDLAEGPASEEPRLARIDWRYSDIDADLTIDFPDGWENYEPPDPNATPDPDATPTPTP